MIVTIMHCCIIVATRAEKSVATGKELPGKLYARVGFLTGLPNRTVLHSKCHAGM